MVQSRERLCFAGEAGQAFAIAREDLRQHLDRDVAIELRIAGAIHLSHAARAQRSDDFVRTETGARRQDHAPERIIAGLGTRLPCSGESPEAIEKSFRTSCATTRACSLSG